MIRLPRFVWLMIVTMVLSGCSANRFLYNRADTFVRWVADDYVTLNRDQQAIFDENLDQFLAWHRHQELPIYRTFIVDSLASLDDGVTLAEGAKISDAIESAADRFQHQFIDLLLLTADALTEAQVQEFLAALDAQQQEYAEERLVRDTEAYYDDSAETMKDLTKRLMGRLEKRQKQAIDARSTELMRIDALWHEDRARWSGKLRTLLEARAPGWQDAIRQLGDARAVDRNPAYAEGIAHNGDIILALLVDTLNARSDRQDRHLRRFLRGLIDDIDALTVATVADDLVVQQR